jgi:hypothetical protein
MAMTPFEEAKGHFTVLSQTPTEMVVYLNPKRFEVTYYKGTPPPKSLVTINGNFFWRGQTIGFLKTRDEDLMGLTGKPNRPIFYSGGVTEDPFDLYLSSFAFEAGPRLLKNGYADWRDSFNRGRYQPDVLRKASRTGIGQNKAGKWVVLFKKDCILTDLTMRFQDLGCMDAMVFDGGSSANLSFHDGKKRVFYYDLARGSQKVTVGIAFTPVK